MKTKEETITEEAKKAFMHYFIYRCNEEDINWELEKAHWFTSVISKYIGHAYDKAYSAGFEACRNKVEEGVKKMRHESVQFGHIELVSKVEVLTTIKEVKE